ncbi:MAG: hybrid sensor histidine kinase/response regulator [SAR324 cluster bacterium]|uniref:histidine kinase n=1 Tax=SAR324 cluster bacterium TaxID=2024889 RepID=A0A7X9FNR8_9DELT|nr:hybrid sensor histidine kinase/response regulator [SAR324 cluster bacterium]
MFAVALSFSALLAAIAASLNALRSRAAFEVKLKSLLLELEQAKLLLKKRGDLANEVAHEIKNPITAILCSAEALDMMVGETLETPHRKSLKYIKEYGEYVLHLISDFLDLSMVEAHVKEAHPKSVEISGVVESVLGLLESSAMQKHIQLHFESYAPELAAYVDPRHLRQILFNLIQNAIKFSLECGAVEVICQDTFPKDQLRISVRDNGVGMEKDELERVFDPYWHNSKRKEGGHGLGLALCKSFVELAGGSINVESKVGVGSCFDVFLPRSNQSTETSSDSFSVDDASKIKPLLGYSFLLVDRDRGARESASALIEAWGGVVDNVSQATEALRLLSQKNFDALVLDASDERQHLSQIAHNLMNKQSTDIILTSKEPLKAELLEELKIKRVVEKPFSGKVLLQSLLDSTRAVLKH